MSTEIQRKIKSLSGLHDIQDFFSKHQIEDFSASDLRVLCIQMATQNATRNLDAYFQIAYNALENKKSSNRIWIPVILSSAFSLISLILSSWQSIQQNKLNAAQYRLLQPSVTISRSMEKTPGTTFWGEEILTISNEGESLIHFDEEVFTSLLVKKNGQRFKEIPIVYFVNSFSSSRTKGKLVTKKQPRNAKHLYELDRSIQNISEPNNFYELELIIHVKTNYKDLTNQDYSKCFKIPNLGYQIEVSNESCTFPKEPIPIDISKLTLGSIFAGTNVKI